MANTFDAQSYIRDNQQYLGFDPQAYIAENQEYLSQDEQAEAPKEDPRDFIPAMKNAGAHMLNLGKESLKSVASPVKTANEVVNNSTWKDQAKGIYRTARSVPIVGQAIDQAATGLVGIPQDIEEGTLPWQSPGPKGMQARQDFRDTQQQEDYIHEKEHPVMDFVQRAAGLAALPPALIPQLGIIATDTFNRSIADGASTYDAMRDVRNTTATFLITMGGLKGAGKVAKGMGNFALKETLIDPKHIEHYKENQAGVNESIQKYGENKNYLAEQVGELADPFFNNVDQAEVGLRNARLASQKTEMPQIPREVREAQLNETFHKPVLEDATARLEQTKVPPVELAAEIPPHINASSDILSELSYESFDRLAKEGRKIDGGKLYNAIWKKMKSLKVNDAVPTMGADGAAYTALAKLLQFVEEVRGPGKGYRKHLQPSDVKRIIQIVDSESKAAYRNQAGSLTPEGAKSLAEVRRAFDEILKQTSYDAKGNIIPGSYAEKMAELAPQVDLVSKMSEHFGDHNKAMQALQIAKNPQSPGGYLVRQRLEAYDKQHGTDFLRRVKEYYDEPVESFNKARSQQMQLEQRRLNEEQRAREQQFETQFAEKRRIIDAEQNLYDSKKRAEDVSQFRPKGRQNSLRQIQLEKNPGAKAELQELSPELYLENQNQGTAREFMKRTPQGSRRAKTVGSVLGGVAGYIFGDSKAAVGLGGGLGALLGALADTYGGIAVKRVVDAKISINKLKNSPYLKPLMEAAQKGPQELATYHYLKSSSDAEYQRLMNAREEESDVDSQ